MKDLRTPPRVGVLAVRRDAVLATGRAAVLLFGFFPAARLAAGFLTFFTLSDFAARARAFPVVLLFFRGAMGSLRFFNRRNLLKERRHGKHSAIDGATAHC
jgi:hypothetical protein